MENKCNYFTYAGMRKEIKDCGKCRFYGECDHQGSYVKDGRWCFE